jgi:hypothetical protein
MPIGRLPGGDVHWLFFPLIVGDFPHKTYKVASNMIRESSNPASLDAALDCAVSSACLLFSSATPAALWSICRIVWHEKPNLARSI